MNDWDNYFLNFVHLLSTRSKDQNTHIGAIVVNRDNIVKATGYNSFPRGIKDDVSERQSRENGEKYFWMEHAERNAIYPAAREGVSLKGCRIYISAFPCADCARAIIQVGIKEIIIDSGWEKHMKELGKWENWKASHERSVIMLEEADVLVRSVDIELINIHRYCDGKEF